MTAVAVEMPPRTRAEAAWQDRARCVGTDPEMFFPEHGGNLKGIQGIWGGTSDQQRQEMRRDLGITMPRVMRDPAPCGTPAAYKRHQRKREPVDDACRVANAEDRDARGVS